VILVDTSIWIDFLRGESSPEVERLDVMMTVGLPFGITGVIYQEILQGADSEQSFSRLAEYFGTQRFFHALDPVETHARAAELYARCRRSGITVRSTIDCLIAQIAIEHDLELLHSDRDFDNLASVINELRISRGAA
jgi:predicted nucleic acid-binding protein